jgi:signal transduction histidine kinase
MSATTSRIAEMPTLRRQPLVVAVICAMVDLSPLALRLAEGPVPPVMWLVAVLTLGADLALALPTPTSGAVAVIHAIVRVGAGTLMAGFAPSGPAFGNLVGSVVAGFRAGAWSRGAISIAALASLVTAGYLTDLLIASPRLLLAVMQPVADSVVPWLMGRYSSAQHAYLDELKQRAEREQRSAQEAHAEERGRIARDLHDTISHHVSAIGMQAGAARLGLPDFPQRSPLERLLSQIETSGRAAMADLHRMLDLLHGARRDGARQPSLDNLDELVEGVTAAGMDVRVSVHDIDPGTFPQSLDITAYRIVQEILTNALRHGAGGTVRLDLSQSATELTVSSTNVVHGGGRGSESGANRGLNGIRDRAALFRGTVTCGPVPERGVWRIGVTFPLTKEQGRQ